MAGSDEGATVVERVLTFHGALARPIRSCAINAEGSPEAAAGGRRTQRRPDVRVRVRRRPIAHARGTWNDLFLCDETRQVRTAQGLGGGSCCCRSAQVDPSTCQRARGDEAPLRRGGAMLCRGCP
jgi:hypothetical protein